MTKYTTINEIKGSDEFIRLNPQLTQRPAKEPKTEARKRLEREIRETFARMFEAVWARNGGPVLESEFCFCGDRGWRADYRRGDVLIELEGGVYTGGRHSRGGKAFCDDAVKYNTTAILGYTVIRIPTGFATDNYVSKIIEFIKSKEKAA